MSDLDSLKNKARRDDYASMVSLARGLLGSGSSPQEVLRTCYGVSFPDEFFVIAELRAAGTAPAGFYMNQPWNLIVPLDRGGPPAKRDSMDHDERRVYALNAELIPLMTLKNDRYVHGGSILCYRRDELAEGRSTVFGLRQNFDLEENSTVERSGDSLVAVLHEHFADAVERLQAEYNRPYNQGAGAVEEGEVESARKRLATVDEVVRLVAERRS